MSHSEDEQNAAAELRSSQGTLKTDRLSSTENLAFNLIGFFLQRNAVGFRNLVLAEMRRRMPDTSDDVLEAAYDNANEHWIEAYCG